MVSGEGESDTTGEKGDNVLVSYPKYSVIECVYERERVQCHRDEKKASESCNEECDRQMAQSTLTVYSIMHSSVVVRSKRDREREKKKKPGKKCKLCPRIPMNSQVNLKKRRNGKKGKKDW